MRRQAGALLPQLSRAFALSAEQQVQGGLASALFKRCYADDANLKKTVFYDFHVAHGGACSDN